MRSSVRLLFRSLPPGFATALALYQLIPGEGLSAKKALVLIGGFLLGTAAGIFLGKLLKKHFSGSKKWLRISGLLSLLLSAVCTGIFHLSLPQKEILLDSRKITVQVTEAHFEDSVTGIRFLSMNNGYRGIAFADFVHTGSWERQSDQLVLTADSPDAGIIFEGKTGQTAELFFMAGKKAGKIEVNWGDGAAETIDLSRETNEPFSLMLSHTYGPAAAVKERLNFFFNLFSVFIPLSCLLFTYLVILRSLLKRCSRQFALAFLILSVCTVFIRVVNVYNFPLGWDEGTYSRAAMRYSEKMLSFQWLEIPSVLYNHEHPAFVKLMFAIPAALDGREAFARFGRSE